MQVDESPNLHACDDCARIITKLTETWGAGGAAYVAIYVR